jgi:hypothetical protein
MGRWSGQSVPTGAHLITTTEECGEKDRSYVRSTSRSDCAVACVYGKIHHRRAFGSAAAGPSDSMCLVAPRRSAELYSISIRPNRRGPRRFCGARLCEPQHVDSDRCAGLVETLGGRQSCCGSQTRAPLVAALPRCAVSQSCTLPAVGKRPHVGPIPRPADCKSAIRQIENLRYKRSARRTLNRYSDTAALRGQCQDATEWRYRQHSR